MLHVKITRVPFSGDVDEAPLLAIDVGHFEIRERSLVSDGQLVLGGERGGQGEHHGAETSGESEVAKHVVLC